MGVFRTCDCRVLAEMRMRRLITVAACHWRAWRRTQLPHGLGAGVAGKSPKHGSHALVVERLAPLVDVAGLRQLRADRPIAHALLV